jgi:hypothetical protein
LLRGARVAALRSERRHALGGQVDDIFDAEASLVAIIKHRDVLARPSWSSIARALAIAFPPIGTACGNGALIEPTAPTVVPVVVVVIVIVRVAGDEDAAPVMEVVNMPISWVSHVEMGRSRVQVRASHVEMGRSGI